MELLYLWIEEYRNIKRQGFNFSSEYRFDYTWEGDDWQNGKLIGVRNENIPLGFFNSLNHKITNENLAVITNITAIIGENGSGKSSLLDFLVENYNEDNQHKQSENIFIIWTSEYGTVIDSNALQYEAIVSGSKAAFMIWKDKGELDLKSINEIDNVFSPVLIGSNKLIDENIKLIYYSNVFDGKVTKESYSKFRNVSTNYLLRNNENTNQVLGFKNQEAIRKIKLLKENEKNKYNVFPFVFPENMAFTIVNNDGLSKFNDIKELVSIDGKNSYYKIFTNLENEMIMIKKRKENEDSKKKYFLLSTFFNILLNHLVGKDYYFDDSIRGKIELQEIHLVLAEVSETQIVNFFEGIGFNKEIEKLKNYLNFWLNTIKEDSTNITKRFGTHIDVIYFKCDNYGELLTALKNYPQFIYANINPERNYTLINYSVIDWTTTLSTGENIYFNLFSRLYDSMYIEIISNFHVQRNIRYPESKEFYAEKLILLFDEIETGYHPQWQKRFLKTLVEYLPKIFPSQITKEGKLVQRSIQIILTSHSPFVISDLPKDNVIFLRKGKAGEEIDGVDMEGKCIVDKGVSHKKTFGANIHTLLSDSFFMEGGLIGDFAKGKIEEVIGILKPIIEFEGIERRLTFEKKQLELKSADANKQLAELKTATKNYKNAIDCFKEWDKLEDNQKGYSNLRKLIEMIGEPIVRDKLMQMYIAVKSKIDGEKTAKEIEIEMLEQRLAKLKSQ